MTLDHVAPYTLDDPAVIIGHVADESKGKAMVPLELPVRISKRSFWAMLLLMHKFLEEGHVAEELILTTF
jgi:hypothetical protein